ncbi:hypothetical protein ACNJ7E_04680 [Rhodococcus sp. NM-2]|uniref:hypothetical protein n=1 Tax=Rhodococcus sp. NM-2 TaxID=3401174 RepID=UPI003AAEF75F
MPEQSWITAQDLYDQGYTVDGARQLFGEPKTSPDGTLGWEDDWIDRAEGRALIPVLPFLIERLRGHSEVGEAAGELVRLYEELNRRVGTDGAPDPLHHHEISEDELVELGNDRDALNAIYGSPHVGHKSLWSRAIRFRSFRRSEAGSEMARDWPEGGISGGGSRVQSAKWRTSRARTPD